jgi:hypothetical protein
MQREREIGKEKEGEGNRRRGRQIEEDIGKERYAKRRRGMQKEREIGKEKEG